MGDVHTYIHRYSMSIFITRPCMYKACGLKNTENILVASTPSFDSLESAILVLPALKANGKKLQTHAWEATILQDVSTYTRLPPTCIAFCPMAFAAASALANSTRALHGPSASVLTLLIGNEKKRSGDIHRENNGVQNIWSNFAA